MNNDVLLLVYDALKEVFDLQDTHFKKPDRIDEETRIYGSNEYLDSLGLVTLVISIEGRIREKFNVSIALATEKAFSQTKSPFRNVKSLTLYIEQLLQEKMDG